MVGLHELVEQLLGVCVRRGATCSCALVDEVLEQQATQNGMRLVRPLTVGHGEEERVAAGGKRTLALGRALGVRWAAVCPRQHRTEQPIAVQVGATALRPHELPLHHLRLCGKHFAARDERLAVELMIAGVHGAAEDADVVQIGHGRRHAAAPDKRGARWMCEQPLLHRVGQLPFRIHRPQTHLLLQLLVRADEEARARAAHTARPQALRDAGERAAEKVLFEDGSTVVRRHLGHPFDQQKESPATEAAPAERVARPVCARARCDDEMSCKLSFDSRLI